MVADGWTDRRREDLRHRWARGETGSQIGSALGISRSAVLGQARKLGLEQRARPGKRWTTAEIATMRRMMHGSGVAAMRRELPGRSWFSIRSKLVKLQRGEGDPRPAPSVVQPAARPVAPRPVPLPRAVPAPPPKPLTWTPPRILPAADGVVATDFQTIAGWARPRGIAFDGGNVDAVNRLRQRLNQPPFVLDHTRP